MGGYSIVHREQFETNGNWRLARRTLGVGALGINEVEIAPGDQIPAHDETDRDQEEVFIVLEGNPTMVIEGQDHPAPQGTFIRLDPPVHRTMRNDGDTPAQVLIVSAPTSSGYQPMEWA